MIDLLLYLCVISMYFQVMGYPTVWVFDLDKNEKDNNYSVSALGKTGHTATVKEFTQGVEQMLANRKQ